MTERLVVVGGDAAGMSAASQARRRRGRDELEIVAFERGAHTSYSACGIPYWIGGLVAGGRDALVARSPEAFARDHAIDVRLGHDVTTVDLDRREVVARGPGGDVRLGFDHLVLGAGAGPVTPDWAAEAFAAGTRGVYRAQTLPDGEAIRAAVGAGARRAVVCGGGYIGVEVTEALLRRGLDVTVVQRGPQLMGSIDPEVSVGLRHAMEGHGATLRCGTVARGLVTRAGAVTAVATDQGEIPADLVVLALGVRPRTELAAAAGLRIGGSGGIATDDRQRALDADGAVVEGVYAAGDCTEVVHRVYGRRMTVALGTHANKQGRVAGITIGGGQARFPGVVGTAITGFFDVEAARTGLSCAEMGRAGVECVHATIESTTIAGYLPDAPRVTVRLVAEAATGRVVGGQMVGGRGAGKRIDTIATAVTAGMTAEDLVGLDLAYCPPYSPVWDPVQVAARKLLDALG
jgi:NADPH-dependent 2,4-dienoyl-CoA reductase/sulfur reductase-like enzyme